MTPLRPALLATKISIGLLLAGCSGPSLPPTAKVSGTVTYKGAPVDGATVVFSPAAGGRPATAVTDSQGHFDLSSFGEKDGAPLGDYNVSVSKTALDGPVMSQDEVNAYVDAHGGQSPPAPATKQFLPEKYASPATSGISKSIQAGENTVSVELTD